MIPLSQHVAWDRGFLIVRTVLKAKSGYAAPNEKKEKNNG